MFSGTVSHFHRSYVLRKIREISDNAAIKPLFYLYKNLCILILLIMNEVIKKFLEWSKLKIEIHSSEEINFYFKEREIWWTSIGQNIGSEQNGIRDLSQVRTFSSKTLLRRVNKMGIEDFAKIKDVFYKLA